MNKEMAQAVALLVKNGAWKATKYISPTQVLRVTRRRYLRGRGTFARDLEMVVHYGKPNYAEREFIQSCRKAGESFPVKKIQLKAIPRRKS